MVLEQLFKGKIRLKLLVKLFLNPNNKVFLRGLELEFNVSSNTVRLELGKLQEMQLIAEAENDSNARIKEYIANTQHPLFDSLRNIVFQYLGIDQIVEQILDKLGNVEKVYLTGALAEGRNANIVDLVLVGEVDKAYMYRLCEKAETLIDKKIRIATFLPTEFSKKSLKGIQQTVEIYG